MSDLLSFADPPAAPDMPLAERLRPRSLDEVIGQQHLLGPGKPLRAAFESGQPHSMILWGPPGVGKTTLARLMADAFDAQFIQISAVLGGVKDIRDAVEQAQVARSQGRRTIVFVDEVHRFNKAQQDAFLPHVESGLFTFIGATTENPSFEVNSALLSRATVHVLQALGDEDMRALLERARALLGSPGLTDAARDRLIGYADGDARRLLNTYENLVRMCGPQGVLEIDEAMLERSLGEQLRRYDKGGEQFYDTISALHKSVRGSDPDAALYWLVRMLDGGVDARYIARRLIRMACEDIGLADPRALRLTLDAAETYERLGSPEGELALAEAVVYLAVAAKSNAVYAAYNAVRAFVKRDGTRPVPLHLRNAPTRLMKDLGYGKGYRYAHDEEDAFAAGERYFPEGIPEDLRFYEPAPRGLEIRIGEKLEELRKRNEESRKRR
ncbi:replication-associated recombination protein A [Caldimonas thermodepolymerans]|jgi:ATPase related to the helicase subunit of the Holliday junction resolvase|uniref:Replication-associated recombination protein A n=1 Tax=Caldimonas thermodepolymerans TaxID=215580 RepID=A0A2S5T4I8_9BURK|nr:replication-associated recombination protein A [Caldimonas thermodepolymerans]PPE69797.1 recombination factor protein RarA [Caldimonas thermodepolymerans]QPC32630.1 replication-associated recombination protein A [Caldimonas thermodepolymerans]RDI03384.1 recombination protein MgsA [Caldimonas thermodepolymerans]TCP06757.1 recombination protein MgsA [Caldimonas thermodepolymerans]UZG45437.1 replication-associated recombination protein A [Caldimonas thermodepolymerans]